MTSTVLVIVAVALLALHLATVAIPDEGVTMYDGRAPPAQQDDREATPRRADLADGQPSVTA